MNHMDNSKLHIHYQRIIWVSPFLSYNPEGNPSRLIIWICFSIAIIIIYLWLIFRPIILLQHHEYGAESALSREQTK